MKVRAHESSAHESTSAAEFTARSAAEGAREGGGEGTGEGRDAEGRGLGRWVGETVAPHVGTGVLRRRRAGGAAAGGDGRVMALPEVAERRTAARAPNWLERC